MNINAKPSPQAATRHSIGSIAQAFEPIDEMLIATRLRGLAASGNLVVQDALINLYVSLKSKPLSILIGPKGCGKTNMIKGLASVLTHGADRGFHLMSGHAHWAAGSSNLVMLTQAQTRFTSSKLLALIEEAHQPENRGKYYMACISQLSRAELCGYFDSLAFQLRHNCIMRLPAIHFNQPIPYPENVAIIGTIDLCELSRLSEDLLRRTSIICWNHAIDGDSICLSDRSPCTPFNFRFSEVAIRDSFNAKAKLRQIPSLSNGYAQLLNKLYRLFKEAGVQIQQEAISEVHVYLSNAWTDRNIGLFDPSPLNNLNKAFDFAMAQAILPRVWKTFTQSRHHYENLNDFLGIELPHTQSLLAREIQKLEGLLPA